MPRGMTDELRAMSPKERVEALKAQAASDGGSSSESAPRSTGPTVSRVNGGAGPSDKPLIESIPDDIKPQRRGRKPGTSSSSKDKAPAPAYREGMFVEPVMRMYAMVGMGVSMFDKHEVKNEAGEVEIVPLCGQAIMAAAEPAAKAWDKAAKADPAIRKALSALMRTSVWGELIAAHAPIALAIASNHMPGMKHDHDAA